MNEDTSPTSQPPSTVKGDRGLFARCPDCDGSDFLIEDVGAVLFVCLSCDARWHYSLGYVWRENQRRPTEGTVVP